MISNRRYDFYFEYNNRHYLVEFDGEQHFHYVRKYHKSKGKFNECQIVDRIKTYSAWKSNMTIIRIDYTQNAEHIRYHLINGINSLNMVYLSNPELYRYITDLNITNQQLLHYLTPVASPPRIMESFIAPRGKIIPPASLTLNPKYNLSLNIIPKQSENEILSVSINNKLTLNVLRL